MMSKLFPRETVQKEKKKEERRLPAKTFVIVLSSFLEHSVLSGKKKRIPRQWDLGEVVRTVIFFEGEEAGTMAEVTLLELPSPEKRNRKDGWEEWQANDFLPVPVPEDGSHFFRDYRMLMRLDSRAQFAWVRGKTVTVPYRDLIRQATYSEWMRLFMTAT